MHFLKKIFVGSVLQAAVFGLLLTAVIVAIWDVPIEKYRLDIEPFEGRSGTDMYWFAGDFDSDGNSEVIRCYNSDMTGRLNIVHYDEEGNLTDNWYMNRSEWNYYFRPAVFDIDSNGSDELLFFSVRNDSIFLNALNLVRFNLIIDHHFFQTIERKRKDYAFHSAFSQFGDFDSNGTNELFFWFDAGYGLYPRGVFKMELPSLAITASPTEHMRLTFSSFNDLTNDGIPEILTACAAPHNSMVTHKYTDSVCYIAVLDYNLNLLFEPIPFGEKYSSLLTIPAGSDESFFFALVQDRSNVDEPFKLMTVNGKGEILSTKSWNKIQFPENLIMGLKSINSMPQLIIAEVGRFNLTKELTGLPDELEYNEKENIGSNYETDLNTDGNDELISLARNNTIVVYNERENVRSVFTSPVPVTGEFDVFPIIRENKKIKYMFAFKSGYFFISYYKNPLYFLVYFIYIGLFALFSGITFMLLYFQQRKLERKWNFERQISELQFNAIKNQLHPHFMFNALNSVAHLINEGQHEQAYDFLTINSRMIQQVMNDAKEVKRKLKAEIRFTGDYIKIQQQRFKDKFNVELTVHPGVNLDFDVPKMCIHTYVENAVKHGFRETRTGGLLKIEVSPLSSGVFIAVTDNGMGRAESLKSRSNSGRGLSIMEEFYRLFEKYHSYSIRCNYFDLSPGLNGQSGLRVELQILLPVRNISGGA